jgi:hypothetical protein
VHLFLDICQGIGLACAAGVRPFLPTLLAGALAADDLGVDFDHTDSSSLESPIFFAALAVAAVAYLLAERRLGSGRVERGFAVIAIAGIILGGMLCAGSIADHHSHAWLPGFVGGALAAAVAAWATWSLWARTRARLDAQAARALPAYAEGAALLLAGLSIAVPPLGLIALLFLLALLVSGRRREDRKYAGLRILR